MPSVQITDATAEALGGDPARIRVVIYEVSPDAWGIGGQPVSATISPGFWARWVMWRGRLRWGGWPHCGRRR